MTDLDAGYSVGGGVRVGVGGQKMSKIVKGDYFFFTVNWSTINANILMQKNIFWLIVLLVLVSLISLYIFLNLSYSNLEVWDQFIQ